MESFFKDRGALLAMTEKIIDLKVAHRRIQLDGRDVETIAVALHWEAATTHREQREESKERGEYMYLRLKWSDKI
jgi:hypothetical protein